MSQNDHSQSHSTATYRNPPSPVKTLTRRKNSDGVEEFNEEYANIEDKRYSSSSPYYRGLTNFAFFINRDRLQSISIPTQEIQSTGSVTSSSSSRFSYIVKIQNWSSSCFVFNKKSEAIEGSGSNSKSSRSATATATVVKEGKSLREKSSSPPRKSRPESPPETQLVTAKKVVLNAKDKNESESERKFVWADKYRPDALKDFICNKNKAIELQDLSKAEDCCHFIFEGLPGVGKRTMIWALLREAFGADKVQAREECKEFDLKGEAVSSILVHVKESPQHVEVNLSELKGYEKQVIVELIKETNTRLINKALQCSHDNCRAIILYQADKLSSDALLYIRWILERYRGCNKVFFCCNDISKLQPIKSLCTIVQLLPPSNQEIVEVLEFIAKQEGIELPHKLAETIASNSNNNLRQAIRSLEATWQSNSSLEEDQVISTGWEDDISKIAKNIVEEQSPKQLYAIRGKLQKLIEHNVSPQFIFKTLLIEVKKNVDEKLHMQIDCFYNEYNREDDDIEKQFQRNQADETSTRYNDPVKNNVKHFLRIEGN
ncbi:hypothetical protein LguiA_019377 [Lonicera macranthoides]